MRLSIPLLAGSLLVSGCQLIDDAFQEIRDACGITGSISGGFSVDVGPGGVQAIRDVPAGSLSIGCQIGADADRGISGFIGPQ